MLVRGVGVGDVVLDDNRRATAASVLEVCRLHHRAEITAVTQDADVGEPKGEEVEDAAAAVVQVATVAATRAAEKEARTSRAVILRHLG